MITETSFLRICAGHRGGRTAHITLKASGGILEEGKFPDGVLYQLTCFLNAVKEFAEQRRNTARQHELFVRSIDPVPVSITKVFTSRWGTGDPQLPPGVGSQGNTV